MALSSAVRDRCRPFLPAGEEIHYLFPAWSTLTPGMAWFAAHFLVAVTSTKITVLSCGMRNRDQPESIWAQYPRTTRIGPVETGLEPEFMLGGTIFITEDEYIAVIRAADAEITAPDFPLVDPLQDF